MGRIPQRFIDDLLDRADIVDIVGARIDLRKSGKNYSARCPFHDEKTPSFTVSPDKQFYYCFGCGAGGNAIGFVMDYDHLDFPRAVESLASHCGMEVPDEGPRDPVDGRRKQLYTLLEQADNYYRGQLRKNPQAIDYLKGRGLSGEVVRNFGIGFAPPGWDNLINSLAESDGQLPLLAEAGLAIKKEGSDRYYDRFRNRIQFPIRDTRGRTIGFGGRVLGDEKPKYLNSPETPVFHKGRELYGLFEAHRDLREIPNLVMVEGYMDVVALAQHGIRNAVATLGTAASAEHLEKLFRYTPEVIFCFDGDNAGRQAARRALETVLPAMADGRNARFLFLDEGEDPDTLVRKIGAEGFSRLLARAQPLSDYLFTALGQGLDTDSLDGKARLSRLAAPLINRMPTGVYRQLMLQELARRTGMEIATLQSLIAPPEPAASEDREPPPPEAWDEGNPPPEAYGDDYPEMQAGGHGDSEAPYRETGRARQAGPPPAPAKRLKLSPVRRLISLLLHEPGLLAHLDLPGLDTLDDPDVPMLLNLEALLRQHPDYTFNHILGYWRGVHGPEEGETLARIAASDLLRATGDKERDNLTEFTDICRHLAARIHREHPPREQLDSLLNQDRLSPDDRKRLMELWQQLTAEERTPDLNNSIKQALAKKTVVKEK